MSNDIYFVVETALVDDNRKLQALTPDDDGFYCGIPMCALDIVTRNKTQYDSKSLIENMTNPNTTFNTRLRDGELFGENGHPFIYKPLSDPESVARLFRLDSRFKACHYKKFYSKKDEGLGVNIIYSDLKPMGPYGKYAEEQLLDPNVNFSTSLRALSSEQKKNGILFRNILNLITFDVGVPGGGFKYSSKRYYDTSVANVTEALSHESLRYIADHYETISMEGLITESELNDLFKRSKIKIKNSISCFRIDKKTIHVIEDNKKHSLKYITSSLV
jgi:hypothetical protein